MAKAGEIIDVSRRNWGISDPVTSDQQGAVVADYLKRSKAAEDYNSVADLFQSEVDRRPF